MNADPNARDQLLNDLSGTLAPSAEPISDTPLAPPVIPDHELIRRIGRGSYGEVWLARSALGTWRAVKVVHRAAFDHDRPYDREFEGIRRFEPVSRTHPSQLNVLHVGRNDAAGHFYYVMELADAAEPRVEGSGLSVESAASSFATLTLQPATYIPRTLRSELFHRGRLPFEQCLDIGLALATALDHLHRHELVHRDIKPSNIIFVNGIPKLADIGLVAQAEATLSLVGTEGYLPPEGPGTVQADIFSLGKVLYEMATGRDRQEYPELPTNLIAQPAADRAQLGELNEIIICACHTDLKQRYQTAAELHADLAMLQSGKSVTRMRAVERRLKFVARAGALVTAVAVLAGGGWLWQHQLTREARRLAGENQGLAEAKTQLANENREQLVRLRVANGVRLMDEGDLSGALLWFADALPLVANRPAEEVIHRIRIQQVLQATPRLLRLMASVGLADHCAWSPDGRRIALATRNLSLATNNHHLFVYDRDSGNLLWHLDNKARPLVSQLRFSRDGKRLLGLLDGAGPMAVVWEAESGREVYRSVDRDIYSALFSPDDRWLAVAETNRSIGIFNAGDGTPVLELKGHTNEILQLSFGADGTLLASASADHTARIWRLPSGEPLGAPLPHRDVVQRAILSEDGHQLLTQTYASEANPQSWVQLWDVPTGLPIGRPVHLTNAPNAEDVRQFNVTSLLFSPGAGDQFLLESDHAHIQLWNTHPLARVLAQDVTQTRGPRCWTTSRWDFSPDGRRCVAGLFEGSLALWNRGAVELERSRARHSTWIQTASFSPDGRRLLTTGADEMAKIWSVATETESARLELPTNFAKSKAWDMVRRGRGPGPISVLMSGRVGILDPDRLVLEAVLEPRQPGATIFAPTAGSTGRFWACQESAANGASRTIDLWEKQGTNFHCLQLPCLHGDAFEMGFSRDDSRLVTYDEDRSVRIYRTEDGTLERTIPLPPHLYNLPSEAAMANPNGWFLPDAKTLVCASVPNTNQAPEFQLFDLTTGQMAGQPFRAPRSGGMIAFSPDGNFMGSVAGMHVTITDLRKGALVAPEFRSGGADLHDLDWSPDGQRVITAGGGYPADVRIHDAKTGELLLLPLLSGERQAIMARWSADGRFIVSRNNDKSARVWDASTAEPITPMLRHQDNLRWCCITPNNRLITASGTNLIRAWDLKPTLLAQDVIADYAKLLSGRRLNASGALLALKPVEMEALWRSLRARAPQLFK
jgi:WD40 repeat protein